MRVNTSSPLLYVEWMDHFSAPSMDWASVTAAEENDIEPIVCRSVGWLVKEDRLHIYIMANFDGEPGNDAESCFGGMTILKSAIVRKVPLKVISMKKRKPR